MPREIATPLERAITSRIKALRKERGWTQDELAGQLRKMGFEKWTRMAITALEADSRRITIDDLVAFSLVFDKKLADLIHPGAGHTLLGEAIALPPSAVALLFAGTHPKKIAKFAALRGKEPWQKDAFPNLVKNAAQLSDERIIRITALGDFEQNIAAQLGTTPEKVVVAAFLLWGRSPSEERDARSVKRPNAKQHVSRELIPEIKVFLDQVNATDKKRKPRKRGRE